MQKGGPGKIKVFLCLFESVLLASFQFFYVFHLMTCHCGHEHGAHGTGCEIAHIQPDAVEAPSLRADTTILNDEVCPAGKRESRDHATCPVCRLFANLSRILPSETAALSFYDTRQGEAAILPFLAVSGAVQAAAPARAPPFLPVS